MQVAIDARKLHDFGVGTYVRKVTITDLIEGQRHDRDSFRAIQSDVTSLMAREMMPYMLAAKPATEAGRAALDALPAGPWLGALAGLFVGAWLPPLAALALVEVSVAGTHGETIFLTQSGTQQNLNGKMKILHHLTNDNGLLSILLTDYQKIRATKVEELDANGGDPAKVGGTGYLAQALSNGNFLDVS